MMYDDFYVNIFYSKRESLNREFLFFKFEGYI